MREMGWWILDENHTPQYVGLGIEAIGRYHDKVWQRVDHTLVGPYEISTVFLGIDHGFIEEGPPILFETMVFCQGSRSDLECERYATWDQAVAGHNAMVEEVRSWGWKRRLVDQWDSLRYRLKLYWRVLRTKVGSLLGRGPDFPSPTPPRPPS
jgi:hypothetical protein